MMAQFAIHILIKIIAMSSYKSILDSLLESASNIIVAKIRCIKETLKNSSLNNLPASADTKLQHIGLKEF
jgi:hypothetical protein